MDKKLAALDSLDTATQPDTPDRTRRDLALALLALLGGGAVASRVEALPLSARLDFFTVNRLLAKYGIAMSGSEDRATRQDTIDTTIHPVTRTRYVSTIELPDDLGAIIPCIKTSYFDQITEFTHLMPNHDTGEVTACFRTVIAHDHHDRTIIPCVSEHYNEEGTSPLCRMAVPLEHEEATFSLLDPTAGPDSAAPLHLQTRWAGDGSVSEVRLAVGPENFPLSIDVGGKRYELKGGELVQQ